jgi:hypothetical protein
MNLKKCDFIVFSRMILGFIVLRKGNYISQEDIGISEHVNSHQPIANTSIQLHCIVLQVFHEGFYVHNGTYNKIYVENITVCVDNGMSTSMGVHQEAIYQGSNVSVT